MAEEPGADSGSKQRVAYDLMRFISHKAGEAAPKGEEEILVLYYKCLRTVSGHAPK